MKKLSLLLALTAGFFFSNAQSDGTLDVSFDTDGKVQADNGNVSEDSGNDLLLKADKGIVVGGSSYVSSYDLSFCAFTSSGALNTSFSGDGKLLIDIDNGSNDYLNALALDSNEKIVGVGYSIIDPDQFIMVIRLNADGTPDLNFGTDGIVLLNPSLKDIAYDVAIQPDNKIVLVGFVNDGLTPSKALIIRLNEDGTYDGSFGDNGVWEGSPDPSYDAEAYSVALQSDGNIVIGGHHNINGDDEFAVGRILSGGSMDTGFDVDGWSVKNLTSENADIIHGLAIQTDGKIVAAGESAGAVAVWRLNTDGTDDTGFSNSGTFVDALQANDDYLYDVTLQTDGKIVGAGGGSIDDNVDFLVLRLNTDGSLDETFSDDGVVYTDFNSNYNNDFAYSVLLQPDERIVAAGTAQNGYDFDFALARYGNGFTEIENNFDDSQILVYPNPSDGNFVVNISNHKKAEIAITDVIGRELLHQSIGIEEEMLNIDLTNQPRGIYFLELRDESNRISARKKILTQ